jgi:hypothetical protein
MHAGIGDKEAVQLAKERLGEATAQELAAYIQEAFGLTIRPPIVTVLLGTLLERAALDRSAQEARERIERWKVENPEEAKKLAASERRREAARRRKAQGAGSELPDAAATGPQVTDPAGEVSVVSRGGAASGDLPGLSLRGPADAACDGGVAGR